MGPEKVRLGEDALGAVTGGQRPPGEPPGGSSGDDTIVGNEGSNIVAGRDGDDWLVGKGGNDMLGGGAGDDILQGGYGDDSLAGGAGADEVRGYDGDDTVFWSPGEGNDTLMGEDGTDTLRIDGTSLDLAALLGLIVPDAGSPAPRLEGGVLDVTGVSGTITLGGETIQFSGFEQIEVSGTRAAIHGR